MQKMKVYRGTQRRVMGGVLKGMSFAYSLPVAIIWSAHPGDPWASRKTHFLPTSTVHTALADDTQSLELSRNNFASMAEVLQALDYGYPGGITEPEVRKIYNYLHNRLVGRAKGGKFLYQVFDEDGERLDEGDVPFSIREPETLISWEARTDWDSDPEIEVAGRLIADTFIFADAPAVQKAALRLGYTSLIYPDVFAGGTYAAEDLLGEDVEDLEGIKMEYDLNDDYVPTHKTFRVLDPSVILEVVSTPTEELAHGTE